MQASNSDLLQDQIVQGCTAATIMDTKYDNHEWPLDVPSAPSSHHPTTLRRPANEFGNNQQAR